MEYWNDGILEENSEHNFMITLDELVPLNSLS
jgi:hypothetical protein